MKDKKTYGKLFEYQEQKIETNNKIKLSAEAQEELKQTFEYWGSPAVGDEHFKDFMKDKKEIYHRESLKQKQDNTINEMVKEILDSNYEMLKKILKEINDEI